MFEPMSAAEYRKLDYDALEARKAEVIAELENGDSVIGTDVLSEEARLCNEEFERRNRAVELRNSTMKAVASGAGNVVASSARKAEEPMTIDRFDTPEYRQAFMDFVCRGVRIPESMQYRTDAITTTSDASAVIPTTIMQELIREMDTYGEIYARVRKLNVQGGVEFPILSLLPSASWIGESETSDYQKLQANTHVSFTYHGVEVRLAQTLLTNVVTFEMFQREFVTLASEAIVKALEVAIVSGNGTGKPKGFTVDTRIPNANTISMMPSEVTSWNKWHTKVKAKMKKAYRNGVFIMNQATWDGKIAGMVDENGQPIARVTSGINGEEIYRFMGKEVITVEDELFEDYDSADANDLFGAFIDLSNYALNSNLQMRTEQWWDPENNQYKYKCIMICDGKLLDPNGVLLLKKVAESGTV